VELYSCEGGEYTLRAANEFTAQWIEKNALGRIRDLLGGNVQVRVKGKE